jgi:hypothetical protein
MRSASSTSPERLEVRFFLSRKSLAPVFLQIRLYVLVPQLSVSGRMKMR